MVQHFQEEAFLTLGEDVHNLVYIVHIGNYYHTKENGFCTCIMNCPIISTRLPEFCSNT